MAALGHGKMINFASVASDAQVSKSTVTNYYQVLEDTLLASLLQPWRRGKTRKAIQTPKIYLFDNGSLHALPKSLAPATPEYGDAFESWIHHELRTWVDLRDRRRIDLLALDLGFEVDFILNDEIALKLRARRLLQNGICALCAPSRKRLNATTPYGVFGIGFTNRWWNWDSSLEWFSSATLAGKFCHKT